MARQRNPSGGFSPSSAGIGQQIMYTPEWADIDFAEFKGLDMNLVNQNAQFAQEVANKRLDDVLKKRDALLESVKLHKIQSGIQDQLDSKLASIIDNMGQLQLSDAANYTALNTNLIRAKSDPVLQAAVKSSADATAYEKAKFEKPEIAEQPWNNENEQNYQKFLKGETNDFSFNPIYKEYDVQAKADEFAKQVPPDVLNAIVKYGVYGLQEKAVEDKSVGRILTAFNPFKQGLMQDPEFMSWYKRRGKYEETRGGSIDDVINNMFKSAAAKYGTTTPTVKVGMPREEVDLGAKIRVAEANRDAERFAAEKKAGFPSVTGKGTEGPEPDNYIDFTSGVGKVRGKSLTEGQSKTLRDNVILSSTVRRLPFFEDGKTKDMYKKLEPDPKFDPAFQPTGNIETVNTGIVVQYSDNAPKNPKIRYRFIPKEYIEKATGLSVSQGVANTTGTGTYAGVDANGDPIFK